MIDEYAVAPMSLSHTLGNVTAFFTEYIKGFFPKDYFKTVNISSTIAYRYFDIMAGENKEFIKRKKPMLVIRPRLDLMNDSVFLHNTYLTTRITDDYSADVDIGNTQRFFSDQEKGIHLRYLMNRIKMYFDVTLIFESQMEQINQANYLKNAIRLDKPFDLITALENHVPRRIMASIGKDAGIPIENTKEFLTYVNGKSQYPVTYKLKNSTGNDEFFRYYPVQIDTTIQGFNIDDGSKKGFVSDTFAINFTIDSEFYVAGMYYYFSKSKETIDEIRFGATTDGGATIIPFFTIPNVFNTKVPQGWIMYDSPIFKVETSNRPDTLDLTDILNSSILSCIDYHVEKGIPMVNFIDFILMKDNERLDTIKNDFSIDVANKLITVNKTSTVSTYRLFIHVNVHYINNLIATLHNIDEEK